MIPKFLEKLRQGANVIEEMNVNISAPATLLFARHIEALLREIASKDRTSWNDEEDEYWMVFNCNTDEHGSYVGTAKGRHRTIAVASLRQGSNDERSLRGLECLESE